MTTQGQSADAKVRAAERAFRRLDAETPDETRDAQGWTPELLEAAERQLEAFREWEKYATRELARYQEGP
jgi:hypothetical protein